MYLIDMKSFLLSFFILFLSCGKIVESPFLAEAELKDYNLINLKKIQNIKLEKIMIISDIHSSYEELDSLVSTINKNDLLLITGDVTNLGLTREYDLLNSILKKIKIPFLVSVGNHDLLNEGEENFSRLFGSFNFFVDSLDHRFIIYNNNTWESTSKNYYSNEWLQETLSESVKQNIILSHVPFDDKDRFTNQFIIETKNMFNDNNVILTFNGHNHNYNKTEYENFIQYTVGAIDKKYYLLMSVDELGGYEIEKINF